MLSPMDVHRALRERRTVHAYTRDPVPEAVIERALEAAIHAPNHKLTMPWRFLRVGRETRAALAELAVRLSIAKKGAMTPEIEHKVRSKILDPHELIVVSVVRSDDPQTAREDLAASACAVQNLCLSLWADGVGSKWSTGTPSRADEGYALLGIDREREDIVGFVWVGVPLRVPQTPPRPPLSDFVRRLP